MLSRVLSHSDTRIVTLSKADDSKASKTVDLSRAHEWFDWIDKHEFQQPVSSDAWAGRLTLEARDGRRVVMRNGKLYLVPPQAPEDSFVFTVLDGEFGDSNSPVKPTLPDVSYSR